MMGLRLPGGPWLESKPNAVRYGDHNREPHSHMLKIQACLLHLLSLRVLQSPCSVAREAPFDIQRKPMPQCQQQRPSNQNLFKKL